jgi:hypothetical protein
VGARVDDFQPPVGNSGEKKDRAAAGAALVILTASSLNLSEDLYG